MCVCPVVSIRTERLFVVTCNRESTSSAFSKFCLCLVPLNIAYVIFVKICDPLLAAANSALPLQKTQGAGVFCRVWCANWRNLSKAHQPRVAMMVNIFTFRGRVWGCRCPPHQKLFNWAFLSEPLSVGIFTRENGPSRRIRGNGPLMSGNGP